MTKIKAAFVALTMIAGITVSGAASATVAFNFAPGISVGSSATIIQNFNGTTVAGLTGTGAGYKLMTGSDGATGAAPNSSGTQYLSVLGGGTATYTLAAAVSSLQFDWGTASSDNLLTVFTTGGNFTYTVPNSTAPDGVNYQKNGLLTAAASAGTQITSLSFGTGLNSFEIDNIATAAVPEPASWAMMVLGFGLIGAAARSRRTAVTFA